MRPPRYWKAFERDADEVQLLIDALVQEFDRQKNRSALALLVNFKRNAYRIVRRGENAWLRYAGTCLHVGDFYKRSWPKGEVCRHMLRARLAELRRDQRHSNLT